MKTIKKLPLQLLGFGLSILTYFLIVLYSPRALLLIFTCGLQLTNSYIDSWNIFIFLGMLFLLYLSVAIVVFKIYDYFIDRFQKALSIYFYSSLLWAIPFGVWHTLAYIAQ